MQIIVDNNENDFSIQLLLENYDKKELSIIKIFIKLKLRIENNAKN